MKKFPTELLRILGLDDVEGIMPVKLDETTLRICFADEVDEETAARFQKILNGAYTVEMTDLHCIELEKKREWNWDWEV